MGGMGGIELGRGKHLDNSKGFSSTPVPSTGDSIKQITSGGVLAEKVSMVVSMLFEKCSILSEY